jgi:predicted secreted protein
MAIKISQYVILWWRALFINYKPKKKHGEENGRVPLENKKGIKEKKNLQRQR